MRRIRTGAAAIVAVSALLAAGCQSAQVTTAAGRSPGDTSTSDPPPEITNTAKPSSGVPTKSGSKPVVLRFATIDSSVNTNGQIVAPGVFIRALERLSGGRMKVTVQTSFEDGETSAETDIVKGIAAGTLDGGWPATRAFARAGIRGLEPIEAPFQVTSYAAERSVVTGPAGAVVLKTLDGTGVVGLGLTVGPLRRPWATTTALVGPQQWRGVTFRSYNSPVQTAAIQALGGRPVSASFNFADLVAAGKLRAAETDVAQYALNDYGPLLPRVVDNEVLWPKMEVLSFSRKRFDSLSAQQLGWLRQAAEQAVQASVTYAYDEKTPAAQLCAQGVRFITATPGQLAQLRRAVRPVITALARDPATGPSLAQVQKVAAKFAEPEAVEVPSACRKP